MTSVMNIFFFQTLLLGLNVFVAGEDVAIFAMGCFWCGEEAMEKVSGVTNVESGYTGGHVANPTYYQVVYDDTGHYEAVKVTYDASLVNYSSLLEYFWKNIDPFNDVGQFCDSGDSYRAAIFYSSAYELQLATSSKSKLELSFGRSIVTKNNP